VTTTKQQYLDLQIQLSAIEDTFLEFQTDLLGTDNSNAVDSDIGSVTLSFHNIDQWLQGQLARTQQELVMSGFLSEMKVVFEKYSAKIEIGDTLDGYGEFYGGTGDSLGFKLSATCDGVTATKEIQKSTIASGDLV
jgi:hypothetical protein